MGRARGAPISVGLTAAAIVVAGCVGSGATPQIIYLTPGASVTSTILFITPAPASGGAPTATAAATTAATSVPTAAPTVAATPTPVPALPIISSTTISESGHASGCTNWTITFRKPVVSGVASAAAMNSAISTAVTNLINDFKGKLGEGIAGGPCTLDGGYDLGAIATNVLSMNLGETVYLGGASTSSVVTSVSFRVPAGTTIALSELFVVPAVAASILSTESRTRLAAQFGVGADVAWIASGTTAVMSSFERAWVIAPAGLRLTFAELSVGPHVVGTPTITIPWASLTAVINTLGPAGPFVS